jgi:hypothetical protein
VSNDLVECLGFLLDQLESPRTLDRHGTVSVERNSPLRLEIALDVPPDELLWPYLPLVHHLFGGAHLIPLHPIQQRDTHHRRFDPGVVRQRREGHHLHFDVLDAVALQLGQIRHLLGLGVVAESPIRPALA